MPSIGKSAAVSGGAGADPRRILFAVIALLLLMLLPISLLGLVRAPQPDAAAGEDREALAFAQWQALWSELAERGEIALQPVQTDSSLRAAGDTAFMRYRNLWGAMDDATRRTFQMAALSGDPQRKLDLLQPLARTADARIRFRALLEIARVQRRLRMLEPARDAALTALTIAEVPEHLRADAYFLLADIAWETGSLDAAESALTLAIAADPGFWDARQMRLLVLGRQLGQPRQHTADCLDRTRQMILDLGAMPALAQDRTQFRDIADRFAAEGSSANPAFALIAGLGYRWSGDLDRSRTALSGAAVGRGRLPDACETAILDKAGEWLETRP